MNATSSASSEYIPDPPRGGFYILVANEGKANWVKLFGDGLLQLQGININVLNKTTSNELLNGGLGWTQTEACP